MEYLLFFALFAIPLAAASLYKYRKDKPRYPVQLLNGAIALVFWGLSLWAMVMGLFQVYGAFFHNQPRLSVLGVSMLVAGGCGIYFGSWLIRWVERGFRPAPAPAAPDGLAPGQVMPARWPTPLIVGTVAACAGAVILAFTAPRVSAFFEAGASQGVSLMRWLAWAALAAMAVLVWRAPNLRLALGWIALVAPPVAWFASGLHQWAQALLVFLGPLYVMVCVVPMLLYALRRRRRAAALGE